MSRGWKAVVLALAAAAYLGVGWFVSAMTLIFSAMASGPCETNDCPEGVPPPWAWAVPALFLVTLLAGAVRGVRWVVRKPA